MNIRYYHEFRGQDNVLNRFEILTDGEVRAMEVKASPDALSLEYPEVRKLEPVRGSQATMNLISESVFQFVDLHTDEMRKYLVKFYRAGSLYWLGWLDSELYGEELSAVPPYGVTFKASDFNIMERLRYRDGSENRYTDIVPFITHIRRCLDKLGLPFNKLYISCTTMAEGVTLSASETVLHQLFMMSDNFYDEDNEPMSCREVMEELLRPFGLMLVQKSGNLYAYDYNTIKGGIPMKRYDYATFTYEKDETINFNLGNLHTIGFASTDSSYGFEEMINNVKITSSLYASDNVLSYKIEESSLDRLYYTSEQKEYVLKSYLECPPWTADEYLLYRNLMNDNTLMGALFNYTGDASSKNTMIFTGEKSYLITTGKSFFINVKADTYINTRKNPFDESLNETDGRTRILRMYCNLVLLDDKKIPVTYYDNYVWKSEGWKSITNGVLSQSARFILDFSEKSLENGRIANKWLTNSRMTRGSSGNIFTVSEQDYQKGVNIPLPPVAGYIRLEMLYCLITDNAHDLPGYPQVYPKDSVVNMLVRSVELSLKDAEGKKIPTDDYEFNSYINKNVKTDFEELTLKCISANEEKAPIGKANVLRKEGNGYGLQLSFTRSGQKDILERLLMCTIHSNFTTKNGKITVDIKMTDNPALGYVDYEPILSDNYLVVGCKLDFSEAKTTVMAVGYSDDVKKLSNVPYD